MNPAAVSFQASDFCAAVCFHFSWVYAQGQGCSSANAVTLFDHFETPAVSPSGRDYSTFPPAVCGGHLASFFHAHMLGLSEG